MKKEWRKLKGHIGYQQVDCFTQYRVPESEERERTRKFIQNNDDWKHPKSREGKRHTDPGSSMEPKKDKLKQIHNKIYYNQIIKSQTQRDNFESSKRKVTCHIQGNHCNTISEFFNRNPAE